MRLDNGILDGLWENYGFYLKSLSKKSHREVFFFIKETLKIAFFLEMALKERKLREV